MSRGRVARCRPTHPIRHNLQVHRVRLEAVEVAALAVAIRRRVILPAVATAEMAEMAALVETAAVATPAAVVAGRLVAEAVVAHSRPCRLSRLAHITRRSLIRRQSPSRSPWM